MFGVSRLAGDGVLRCIFFLSFMRIFVAFLSKDFGMICCFVERGTSAFDCRKQRG